MVKLLILCLVMCTFIIAFPSEKIYILKRICAALVFSTLIAMLTYEMSNYIVGRMSKTEVIITVDNDQEVIFRGATVDNKWYWADELCKDSNWVLEEEHLLKWSPYEEADKSITFKIPYGSSRSLGFNTGSKYGKISVEANGVITEQSLYAEVDNQIAIQIANNNEISKNSNFVSYASTICVFLLVLCTCMLFFYKERSNTFILQVNEKREIWADVLRTISIIIIVLLHSTSNVFYEFREPMSEWYNILYLNSFTAVAVPCFFMLSGALLIRKHEGIKVVLKKRVSKIYCSLICWSIVYILIGKAYFGRTEGFMYSFLSSLFKPQESFLWFIYSIVGIYFLLPIISHILKEANKKFTIYVLILFLFFPAVFHDMQYLANIYVDMPKFVLLWPELGLFIWGYCIWLNRDKIYNKCGISVLGFIIGLGITIVGTYYLSVRDGKPNNAMFSCIGSTGVLLMATSLFSLCIALEPKFKKLKMQHKKIIVGLSKISMGIYFVHVLVINCLGNRSLGQFSFTSNEGSLTNMFAGAVLYYLVSAMICYCCSKIPYIRRAFES